MNDDFAAVCGGLALHMQFAAPAKGNEKVGVEGYMALSKIASFVRCWSSRRSLS
jgi:hypothetical protein